MKHKAQILAGLLTTPMIFIGGCDAENSSQDGSSALFRTSDFVVTGYVDNPVLDEISGMDTALNGDFFVHNDEGDPLVHVISERGRYRGHVRVDDARNRDWEDITIVPGEDRRWVVAGDIGDNQARYKTIRLYFFEEPLPGEQGIYSGEVEVKHRVKLRYPDGARDAEALAYDSSSDRLLLMTKRDIPPRLYGIALETALTEKSAELEYLGEIPTFTPPSAEDQLLAGKRARWSSQPTGLDISEDGRLAAVITYRSLYVFEREPEESWIEALQRPPLEFAGPPGYHEEAVTVNDEKTVIHVTTERIPTPLHRLDLEQPEPTDQSPTQPSGP